MNHQREYSLSSVNGHTIFRTFSTQRLKRAGTRRRQQLRRLFLESLEEQRMVSVESSFVDGTWTSAEYHYLSDVSHLESTPTTVQSLFSPANPGTAFLNPNGVVQVGVTFEDFGSGNASPAAFFEGAQTDLNFEIDLTGRQATNPRRDAFFCRTVLPGNATQIGAKLDTEDFGFNGYAVSAWAANGNSPVTTAPAGESKRISAVLTRDGEGSGQGIFHPIVYFYNYPNLTYHNTNVLAENGTISSGVIHVEQDALQGQILNMGASVAGASSLRSILIRSDGTSSVIATTPVSSLSPDAHATIPSASHRIDTAMAASTVQYQAGRIGEAVLDIVSERSLTGSERDALRTLFSDPQLSIELFGFSPQQTQQLLQAVGRLNDFVQHLLDLLRHSPNSRATARALRFEQCEDHCLLSVDVLDLDVLDHHSPVTLTWSQVNGVNLYRILVATSESALPSGAEDTVPSPSLLVNSTTPAISCALDASETLLAGITYFWQVRAGNTVTQEGSFWSDRRSFTTALPGLPAPTLISPAAGATAQPTRPHFDWSDISGATAYRLLIATAPSALPRGEEDPVDSPSLVVNTRVTDSDHLLTVAEGLREGVTYYWQVRGGNADTGQGGIWSGYRSLTTAVTASDVSPGDFVRTTTGTDVRATAGLTANEISEPDYAGLTPAQTLGVVIEGPSSRDGLTWLRVDFGPGRYTGWVRQDRIVATDLPYTRGIDVSHHQGPIDWIQVAQSGIKFAIIKATEGDGAGLTDPVAESALDSRFFSNIGSAVSAGVHVGTYHFARPDLNTSAADEAAWFVRQAGDYIGDGFLPPVLDVEHPATNVASAQLSVWIDTWLDEVQRLSGVRPVLYASSSHLAHINQDPAQNELWIAHWRYNLEDSPDIRNWDRWELWQYAGDPSTDLPGEQASIIPGIARQAVDANVFNGSYADFLAWIRSDTLPAPALLEPANRVANVAVPPRFNWGAVSGANTYRILVTTTPEALPSGGEDPPPSPELIVNITTSDVVYTPPTSLFDSDTAYYWQVRSGNTEGGGSVWSRQWSFTTATTTPSVTPQSLPYHQDFAGADIIPPAAGCEDISSPRSSEVATIEVRFSESVSGVDVGDFRLTHNGSNVTLNGIANLHTTNNRTFVLANLAELTSVDGDYEFRLVAAESGIEDANCNELRLGDAETWRRSSSSNGPIIFDVHNVTPAPRNAPVDYVEVHILDDVNLDTFTHDDIRLVCNSSEVVLDDTVSVEFRGSNLYRINGLASFTTPEGLYEITVYGDALEDRDGNLGRDSASDSWVNGTVPKGVIRGTIWNDVDADGLPDGGDAGLAGWTVYIDANDDRGYDPDTEAAAETDEQGEYLIGNLDEATYNVREVIPAGWSKTAPEASGTLYFSESHNSDGLYVLVMATGAATNIGENRVGGGDVGLAQSPVDGRLFGTAPWQLSHFSSDGSGDGESLAQVTSIGLTYDYDNDTLYSISFLSFRTLDQATGAILEQLPQPPMGWSSLAYADGSIYMFGAVGSWSRYYIQERRWTLVGFTCNFAENFGLTHDPFTDTYYAVGDNDTNLYTVDPVAAELTVVGDTGIQESGGLAVVGFRPVKRTVTLGVGQSMSDVDFGNHQSLSPAPDAIDLLADSDTGILFDDDLTNKDNRDLDNVLFLTVEGTVPGAVLTFYADGEPMGSTSAQGDSTTITTSGTAELADGVHRFTATQMLPDGGDSLASARLDVTIDSTLPGEAAVVSITTDSGDPEDGITNGSTLELLGTADAGALVTVLLAGVGVIGEVEADAADVWKFDFTGEELAEGIYSFSAFATVAAGNVGQAAPPLVVEIDSPAAAAVSRVLGDMGLDGDGVTSDQTLVVSGTAEAGVSISLTLVGQGVVGVATPVTSDQITMASARVTIDPAANLDSGTSYYAQIDSDALTDLAGNAFASFTANNAWEFGTPAFGLTVGACTLHNGGFEIDFSQDLEVSPLNLYDQGGILGPADVTLVGANAPPVRGLIVIHPGSRALTFLSTGNVLPPDVDTVTLRGEFQDTAEGLLDGDGDGTPGGNYVTTLEVATPPVSTVIVRLPDFSRGACQSVNVPPPATGIPVTMSTGLGGSGIDLEIQFDPTLRDIQGFTLNESIAARGATYQFSVVEQGRAMLTIGAAVSLRDVAGSFTLGTLTAEVPDDAAYDGKHVLDITNLHFFDDGPLHEELPSLDNDPIHVATFLGDANCNGGYNAPDVVLLQRVIVQLNTGFAAYQLADPLLLPDVTGTSALQANDATSIQCETVEFHMPNMPPLPTWLQQPPASGKDLKLFISQDLIAAPDQQIAVPARLEVTEAAGIALAGGGTIDFGSELSYAIVVTSDLTSLTVNWLSIIATPEGTLLSTSKLLDCVRDTEARLVASIAPKLSLRPTSRKPPYLRLAHQTPTLAHDHVSAQVTVSFIQSASFALAV